jgi:formamidopyrimidine-DNA glycosylase
MPELPEVETVACSLAPRIVGRRLLFCRILTDRWRMGAEDFDLEECAGRVVTGVGRRGKMLLLHFDNNRTWMVHFKMTGGFLWEKEEISLNKHIHAVFGFAGVEEELRYRDVRKFGYMRCFATSRLATAAGIRHLGPEPLEMTLREFLERMEGRQGRIKPLLLDQSFIAGIGNIYADEILFRSGIHPLTPAGRLSPKKRETLYSAIRDLLTEAVASGGSSIRDFRDSEGRQGRFQISHQVYSRKGEDCPVCGNSIDRIQVGGRSSFFCPRCQPLKRKISGGRSSEPGASTGSKG